MDLARVFGGSAHGSNGDQYAGEGGFRTFSGSAPLPPLTQAFRQAGDAISSVQREASNYEAAEAALMEQIHTLARAVEAVHAHYAAVTGERDRFNDLLASAEGRLAEVQRVVQRYTIVQEPVVASDGYTYERRVIKQYLDECMRSGMAPISQQTQNELNSTLIPNQSLKKLVELLKAAKPQNESAVPSSAAPSAPQATAPSPKAEASQQHPPQSKNQGGEGRLHPCVRVYGYCNYKDTCTYAQYPYDACLSHLKGKCRFGSQCHELHVDFRGPTGVTASRGGPKQ